MNVFIAGGSGAIGVPLVRLLVAGGHLVTASTRSSANASMLQRLGATPTIVDALDAEALRRALIAAHPTHVVHQLTDCKTCHASAWESTKSKDILIPGLDTCRLCHAPSPGLAFVQHRAGFKCSECHTEGMLARLKKK